MLEQRNALVAVDLSCFTQAEYIFKSRQGGMEYLAGVGLAGRVAGRAASRRKAGGSKSTDYIEERHSMSVGGLTLDLKTFQIRIAGRTEQLTPCEFDLLHYLMAHPGGVVPSRQLLQRVWGYFPKTADPSLVRWHLKNLRAKPELEPEHPVYLRFIPHRGYILNP